MQFARLTNEETAWLLTHSFENRGVITGSEVREIEAMFHIDDLDEDGARAARNAVVCLTSNVKTAYREMGNWDDFDRINDTASAVTAVFDLRIDRLTR